MFELTIQSDIAAAHFLRGYDGPCKDLHGHTWKIEVVIVRQELDAVGLVADFAVLKKRLKEFLRTVDHVCLNDLAYFKEHNPTAENIARYVYVNFAGVIAPLKVKRVQVWASGTSSAAYYE